MNRHDERTAGQTESDGSRQALDPERVKPEENAEKDAGKDGGKLRPGNHLHLIAECFRSRFE